MTTPNTTDARALMVARSSLGEYVERKAEETEGRLGFGYRPSPYAPDTWTDLQREHRSCAMSKAPLRVSSLYTDDVYLTDAATFAYRFWHDTTHVRLGLNFTADEECEAADYHLTQLRLDGFGANSLEHKLMHADTMGQVVLLARIGSYPRSQYDFVLNVLVFGLDHAIAIEVKAIERAASTAS